MNYSLRDVRRNNDLLIRVVKFYVKQKGCDNLEEYAYFCKENNVTHKVEVHMIYAMKKGGVATEREDFEKLYENFKLNFEIGDING